MNLGQYQRCSQISGLPASFQYDGSQAMSSQPDDQVQSFDGLPRLPLETEYLNAWPSTINDYNISAPMSRPQASIEWTNPTYTAPNLEDASLDNNCSYYYHCSSTFPRHPQDDTFSLGPTFDGIPRTWQLAHDSRLPSNSTSAPDAYGPSHYARDQNGDETSTFPSLGSELLHNHHDRSRDFARLSISRSPKVESNGLGNNYPAFHGSTRSGMQMSEASDDSAASSREMTAVDLEDQGVDEPYAKLIYRALMSAPNHAMVLQEIYQWFRDNTAKGDSDTKGWMNSIRHNLSMNAAFRKSERKGCGDETKKSTEWVLEEFAVKDGVQSTTRYRKGVGNKKFTKSDNPTPARQTSGRKGGLCASKTKSQRQKVKEDRIDRRPAPRLDASRHLQFHHNTRARVTYRQVSPLTPPNLENISSPYFFPKGEQLDLPYEDICGLEDVQGVYVDDHGPLFDNNQQPLFNNKHPLGVNRY